MFPKLRTTSESYILWTDDDDDTDLPTRWRTEQRQFLTRFCWKLCQFLQQTTNRRCRFQPMKNTWQYEGLLTQWLIAWFAGWLHSVTPLWWELLVHCSVVTTRDISYVCVEMLNRKTPPPPRNFFLTKCNIGVSSCALLRWKVMERGTNHSAPLVIIHHYEWFMRQVKIIRVLRSAP